MTREELWLRVCCGGAVAVMLVLSAVAIHRNV